MRWLDQRTTVWLLALAALALAWPVSAQSVSASVDRSEVSLDDQILLTVAIDGSRTATPQLPPLPDFRVISRGTTMEQTMINGAISLRVSYRYVLIPSRVGEFEIGPVTADVEGRTIGSDPFRIRVLESGRQPDEQADAFLTVSVSDETPYVGEQILYTWRFYRRVRVADARLTALEFGNLSVEELGEVREYDTTVRGVNYRVSELRRALFAQRPGPVRLPASELTCEFPVERRSRGIFDFGRLQTRTRVLRSRELELEVQPIPAAPAGYSGLVGDFRIRSSLSKNELAVGESATLEVRVSGSGNIQLMREPTLPDLTSFKVYEDQPSTRIDRTGERLSGSRTYRKALVPLASGTTEISAIDLVFFDPDEGRFRTRRTEPIPVLIRPGAEDEELMLTESLSSSGGKVAVRVLAEDILPIRTDLEGLSPAGFSGWSAVLWTGVGVVPPAAVGMLWWLLGARRRGNSDDRRRLQAFRTAMSALQRLPEEATNEDVTAGAAQAGRILRAYVGDKLGRKGDSLTPVEVERLLEEAGVSLELALEARNTLERLEAVAYRGDARRFTARQLAQSVETVVKSLEPELGRRSTLDGRLRQAARGPS